MNNEKKRLVLFITTMVILLSSNKIISTTTTNNDFNETPFLLASPDVYENDDDFSTAKEIVINTVQDRSISGIGDIDYVYFSLDSYYNLVIETNGTTGDTVMCLYDEDENLLTYDDDGGNNLFSQIIAVPLLPGLYYLKVYEFGNDEEIANYTLSLAATLSLDLYEPDDCASYTPMIPNYIYSKNINPVGDEDIFGFVITEPANVTLETTGPSGDTEMRVCWDCSDPQTTLIEYDDDDGVGAFSKIELIDLDPGAYYVIVNEFQNNGIINDYSLIFTVENNDTVNDLTPPTISNIETIPSDPRSSQSIDVIAYLEDLSGIKNATLNYRINGEDWYQTQMFHAYSIFYFAGIEPLDLGDFVEYYITATDNSSNENVAIADNGGMYYNFTALSPESNDLYEKDNSIEKAAEIPLNSTFERSISPIGDKDYLNFECIQQTRVIIETTDLSDSDTYLYFQDQSFAFVASDDDSGTGNLSLIDIVVNPGNYTIIVTEDGNDETITDFNITITAYLIPEVDEFPSIAYQFILLIIPLIVSVQFLKRKKQKKSLN